MKVIHTCTVHVHILKCIITIIKLPLSSSNHRIVGKGRVGMFVPLPIPFNPSNKKVYSFQPLGESQPLKVFHRGLLEMLNTLLQNHTEDCLRCIGKILKVCAFLYRLTRFILKIGLQCTDQSLFVDLRGYMFIK